MGKFQEWIEKVTAPTEYRLVRDRGLFRLQCQSYFSNWHDCDFDEFSRTLLRTKEDAIQEIVKRGGVLV